MPLKEAELAQQLERAKARRSAVEQGLEPGAVPKKHPQWRQANARVRQIEGRISSRQTLVNVTSAAGKNSAGGEEEK